MRGPGPGEVTLLLRRLVRLAGLVVLLLVAGAVAFALAEDESVWRGFVWSLDTVATVGSVNEPTETVGQVIKVVLIVLGVGTLFYTLVTLTELVVAGELTGLLRGRRERAMFDRLSDHFIICGFGRVGREVARGLAAAGAPHVVIDHDPENRERADATGTPFIEGDPTHDDVLRLAGIERARALVACVDGDPDNVFITLTAHQMRPDLLIVARAAQEDTEPKLHRAGASHVISPYRASAHAMARLALHPQVFGAVELAGDLRIEEIAVVQSAEGAGRTVDDVRGDAFVIALRKADGRLEPQPAGDARLEAGDSLVALGTPATLAPLETRFQPVRQRGP